MSIYKKDQKCEILSRLGSYRTIAISKLETDALNSLLESRDLAIKETREIAEREGNDSWNVFFSSVAIDEANEAIDLLNELLILASQKSIEQHLTRLAKTAFDLPNTKDLYVFKKLKSHFRDNGINIEIAIHFKSINEIRLVANSIKHGTVVSPELAAISGWTQGKHLSNMHEFYQRVKPHIPLFIEHITSMVEEKCGCCKALSSKLKTALDVQETE